jgi:hypothetical protein
MTRLVFDGWYQCRHAINSGGNGMNNFAGKVFASPDECGAFFGLSIHPKSIYVGRNKPHKIIKDRWTMGLNDNFGYELHLKRTGGRSGVYRAFVLEETE